ncbi:hypothetical protein G6F62_012846 [Rhizopus arrhizus]|nr:hypothetical protein G6F62_012846 [Rhizopus arrhizus]
MNFSNYSIIDQKGKRFLKVGSELLQNTIESKKQIKQSSTSQTSSPAEMSSNLFKRAASQAKTERKLLAPVQETCQRKISMTQKTSHMTFDHKIPSQINQVLSERLPRPKGTSTSSNSSAFSSSKRRRQSQLTKSSSNISLSYKQSSIASFSEPLTTKSDSSQNVKLSFREENNLLAAIFSIEQTLEAERALSHALRKQKEGKFII